MVGHFLSLKWKLFLTGFRTGNIGRTISTILGLLAAVAFGFGGLVLGIALRFIDDPWQTIAVQVMLALAFLVWVFGPITVAGTDGAMDPVRFVLLPLLRRDLAVGLGTSSLLGPGGIATIMMLVGFVIGLVGANLGAPLVVLGALLFLALCVVTSRLVASLVGFGMHNRKTRDLLAVSIPLLVVLLAQLPNLLTQLAIRQGSADLAREARLVASVTRWLPSSFPAQVMVAGREGDLGRALLEMAGGLVLLVILGWWWAQLLQRVMTSPPVSAGETKAVDADKPWTPAVLARFSPRARAVAGRDLKLLVRDPGQRVALILTSVFAVAALVAPLIFLRHQPLAAFIVCGMGFFVGLMSANLYGQDGSSLWVNVAAGDDSRADLLGMLLARILVFLPALALIAVVSSVLLAPGLVVAVLGCSLGAALLTLGGALCTSVVAPYPVTYSQEGVMARNEGNFAAAITQMLLFPLIGVVIGPFLVLAMVTHNSVVIASLAGVGALVAGALACWGLWLWAVKYSAGRQPELLAAVSKRAEA